MQHRTLKYLYLNLTGFIPFDRCFSVVDRNSNKGLDLFTVRLLLSKPRPLKEQLLYSNHMKTLRTASPAQTKPQSLHLFN